MVCDPSEPVPDLAAPETRVMLILVVMVVVIVVAERRQVERWYIIEDRQDITGPHTWRKIPDSPGESDIVIFIYAGSDFDGKLLAL